MNNLLFNFMNDIFVPYLLPVIGTILSTLLAWASAELIKFISLKIKNKEFATFLITITTIVTRAVKATYQTYVEALKGTDAWTKEVQEKALHNALKTAKKELSTKALSYIEKQHGDIDEYLINLIESILYDLKNNKIVEEKK